MKVLNDLFFSESEKKLIIQNMQNIPDQIFDIHTHIFLQEHIQKTSNLLYEEFSFQDLFVANQISYPQKNVANICFWFPHPFADFYRNNEYIHNYHNLNFLLLNGSLEYLKFELANKQWLGIKAYPKNYELWCKNIWSMLSKDTLDVINFYELPLILHLPNNIIDDYFELQKILPNFPNIKFILAHWGNVQKCKNRFEEYKNCIKKSRWYPNLYFDTSWINYQKYLEILLLFFDKKRIFYWSDFPTSFFKWLAFPGKNWSIRLLCKTPYVWVDEELSQRIIKTLCLDISNVVNIHQENIKLLSELLSSTEKEDVFYKNLELLLWLIPKYG